MWLILQHREPDDFVLATGKMHSVREFVELAFSEIGIRLEWRGHGVEEIGLDAGTGRKLVVVDHRYFRPTEVEQLQGDASKAAQVLGWQPSMTFQELVREMVDCDRATMRAQATIKNRAAE